MKASSRGLGNIFHLLDFQGHPTMRTKATTLEVRQHAEKNNNNNNRIKVTDSPISVFRYLYTSLIGLAI